MSDLVKLGNLIRERRQHLNLTTRELAEKIELKSPSEINQIENAKRQRPDPVILKKIASGLGLNYIELYKLIDYIDDEGIEILKLEALSNVNLNEHVDMIKMPVYSGVRAGTDGVICYGEILGYEYFPKMKNIENKFNIKVYGNSMEPMIPEGATITINIQPDLENGQIGVFILNGDEGIVKKFYREEGFIRLVSLNPAFKDKIVLSTQEFHIAGRVVNVSYSL